ncbi:transcription factor HES-5-like [Salmo salar]|uniref:Transcription factor HES-5-like n=1 Tax=Salmo salar TaxID=8030 RepID=A0ABM3CNC4_SALSA|nr:transcription factor HES-5-like [Salmo salar]
MAPTITSAVIYSNEHLTLANKPVVEKLRRDRIKNSTEQIKSLLGPEILNQQPNQAGESQHLGDDSLVSETTATEPASELLLLLSSCQSGLLRCVHEIVHFLSKDEVKTQSQRRLLSHFQSLHPFSDKNRRESDLPQFSSQPSTASAKRRVQSTSLSGVSGRVLQTGTPLSNKLNGPCWSSINVMDSDQRSSSYSACAGCFKSCVSIETFHFSCTEQVKSFR